MFLRRLRAALGLDTTAPEPRPAASGRFALVRQVRSALDLGPTTPESRRTAALLLPLLARWSLRPRWRRSWAGRPG